MNRECVAGSDLKVGDVIEVWWRPGRDTIVSLRPYDGPLKTLFPLGAQLADFAALAAGMTIDNAQDFYRLAR